ncbi:MAG: alkaline phosphatase family protein, partial [Thermoanaerobaculia bacterium]|nr:alkaline phosphatase family protein [Thermoanaerobaculia bacterium]
GAAVCGGILGLLTLVLLTPFTWRRPRRARRLLPWSLTVVLTLAALIHWIHASYYAYLLPPGINVRLIKAAAWLTLCALVVFYTALLHSLQRRPYSVRSVLLLVVAGLVSAYVLLERREAFKPELEAALPSAVEARPRPLLLVVGIDSATLDAILPLAGSGHLPFFAQLIDQGTHGRLSTVPPAYEATLWTSIASGKFPDQHGVLGREVYPASILSPGDLLRLVPAGFGGPALRAVGLRPRPPDAHTKDVLVLWEVLAKLGLDVGVIGWPVSFPSDSALDFSFSERYFEGSYGQATARPTELVERGILFQLSTTDIDPGVVEQLGTEVPHDLLRILAGDLWRESLTTFLMDQGREVRAWFLLLPGLGEVSSRYFGSYSAVQFEGNQRPHHQQSAQFVTAYYRHLDAFLAQLWQRTEGPKLLAVVSAHGVRPSSGIRWVLNKLARHPLEGSFAGAPDGVLFLRGDGVRKGHFLERAELIDVMPTLLYALRFPIARDLDGRVLVSAFESSLLARSPLTFVPSYETLAPEEPAGEADGSARTRGRHRRARGGADPADGG